MPEIWAYVHTYVPVYVYANVCSTVLMLSSGLS